jgi:quercetin dioxygenase-like cupin family protein
MRGSILVVVTSCLALGVSNATLDGRQYAERSSASRSPQEWENDVFRIRRVAIAPGSQAPALGNDDRVMVFLTAGLDGRVPQAEAVFQPRDTQPIANRGTVRFEAIAIGLKDAAATQPKVTPPEALSFLDDDDVRVLIDNPRVSVLKVRYRSNAYSSPLHFHSTDTLVVYLNGGYTWSMGSPWGTYRVRRGDVDLIPANTLHTLGSAGSDPLDLLVVVPK